MLHGKGYRVLGARLELPGMAAQDLDSKKRSRSERPLL